MCSHSDCAIGCLALILGREAVLEGPPDALVVHALLAVRAHAALPAAAVMAAGRMAEAHLGGIQRTG